MKFNKTFVFTFFENKFVTKTFSGNKKIGEIKIPDKHEFIHAENISHKFSDGHKAWILFMMSFPVDTYGKIQTEMAEMRYDAVEIPEKHYFEAVKNGLPRLHLERFFIEKAVGKYSMQNKLIVPKTMVAGQEFNNFVYLFVDLVEL